MNIAGFRAEMFKSICVPVARLVSIQPIGTWKITVLAQMSKACRKPPRRRLKFQRIKSKFESLESFVAMVPSGIGRLVKTALARVSLRRARIRRFRGFVSVVHGGNNASEFPVV